MYDSWDVEYRTYVEKDAALARRFQPVFVSEPTIEDTISILRGVKERYELHHGVRIADASLISAANLSNRYICDRFLPDKAIDLIDEAASRLRMEIDSKPEEIDQLEMDRIKDLFGIEDEIIKGANGILNGKVLRYKNEPVRHKTLDLIGDLALLGYPIKGHVTAARAGHASNVEFVKKLKKKYSKELKQLRDK